MAKTYDYTEITLHDFEAPGLPMSVLQIGAEYSCDEGWAASGFDPGDAGELELGQVTVLSATTGDGMWSDREALGRIEEEIGNCYGRD